VRGTYKLAEEEDGGVREGTYRHEGVQTDLTVCKTL